MDAQKIMMTSKRVLTSAIAGLLTAGSAQAASDFGLTGGLGLEEHSNAARTATNAESDLARLATLDVRWKDDNSAVTGDLDYLARRRDFVDNVQTDETAIDGRAGLRWDVAPRAFDVVLQHLISNSITNTQAADTANNRQRRSVLTGGVDGYLHLSSVDSIALSPRYTDISFSRSSQSDSRRTGVDVDWQHHTNAISHFDLLTNYTQVKFDQSSQDYNSSSVEASYATALARLHYSVGAGYTWIKRDNLPDANGYSLHLSTVYSGETAEYGGSLVRQLTDTSVGLSQQSFLIANFAPADANFDQVDVVTRTQADLYARWNLSAATQLNASAELVRDDYKQTPRDQEQYSGQVGALHTLNSYWSVDVLARYTKQKFLDNPLNSSFKDTTAALGARYQFNPRLSLRMQIAREERKAELASSDYTDRIATLSVDYRFF